MTAELRTERPRRVLPCEAALTVAAVLLAFAALDDITTDAASSFRFEWLGLGLCALWIIFVAARLVRRGSNT